MQLEKQENALENLQIQIDTIKFRGDFGPEADIPKIKYLLDTYKKTKEDVVLYEFTSGYLEGSWDNRISFCIKERDWVYNSKLNRNCYEEVTPYYECELSLHKFVLGHNCYGFNDDLSQIHHVYDFLEYAFECKFIIRESVELHRIDLAELFLFDSPEQISTMMHNFSTHKKYKTKPVLYGGDETCYWKGSETTFKIYDKHKEYKRHGYSKLKRKCKEFADEIFEKSKNIVRVECEIHKRKFNEIYGKYNKVLVEDMIMNNLIDLKDVYLKEKQRLIYEAHDDYAIKCLHDVHQYLQEAIGRRKANTLFGFYQFLVTQGEVRTIDCYSKATFYRNRKALKDLGIPFYEYGFNRSLSEVEAENRDNSGVNFQELLNSNILRTVSLDDSRRLKMVI